jgi:hypothetical protein
MDHTGSYKVFVAIPFDVATKSMYESILRHLSDRYGQRLQFLFGTDTVIGPSPDYSEIETFKAQNRDLLEQFYLRIVSSDIIVADLTHNNPNVHVELGIAISLSKNILRVSGRDLVELASDVRGYVVNKYLDASDLTSKIQSYLDRFLMIKGLPLSEEASRYYKVSYPEGVVIGEDTRARPVSWWTPPVFAMRDGEIKVKFKFCWTGADDDWCGVFLRSGQANPWNGGYLVNIRKNGSLELTVMPTVEILGTRQYNSLEIDNEYTLHVNIDGSNLIASLDDDFRDNLAFNDLNIQSPGNVALGCHRSKVVFRECQSVCRDTIDFTFPRA